MDAIQQTRIEYEQATQALLLKHNVNGTPLCARGRVFRAMSMAPSFKPEQMPAFKIQFERLCQEAEKLIEEYNTAGKAYDAFTFFGGVKAEGLAVPECDCEGCKLYYGN